MSKGFYTAQAGHVVNILPPVNVTGGTTSQAVSMALAAHLTIILQLGVQAAALTGVTVNAGTATAAVGAAVPGATAIPFNLYKQETAGAANDVLGVTDPVAATGFVPAAGTGIFYVIEIDGDTLPAGSDYVQLDIANGANSVIASAVAILSGLRLAGESNPTATA